MILLISLLSTASAADLVIQNESVTLVGSHEFDNVVIINNGRLQVVPYDGSDNGRLELSAGSVRLDDSSIIRVSGAGYRGSNPTSDGPGYGEFGGDAGGGGANGGDGGRGVQSDGVTADGFGGEAYATASPTSIDMGSAGGGSARGAVGASGGGVFVLKADHAQIDGVIRADGFDGDDSGAGGGGAGGGVLLQIDWLECSGSITARGGSGGVDGDAKGGGAGGGVILQYHDRPGRPCTTNVSGGEGLGTWSNGYAGIEYIGELDYDGDGFTWNQGDCESSIPEAFPGAEEICNQIDDDCDGEIDEGCVYPDTADTSDTGEDWEMIGGGGLRCGSAAGGALSWLLLLPLVLRRRRPVSDSAERC